MWARRHRCSCCSCCCCCCPSSCRFGYPTRVVGYDMRMPPVSAGLRASSGECTLGSRSSMAPRLLRPRDRRGRSGVIHTSSSGRRRLVHARAPHTAMHNSTGSTITTPMNSGPDTRHSSSRSSSALHARTHAHTRAPRVGQNHRGHTSR